MHEHAGSHPALAHEVVASSSILSVGYAPEAGTLEIVFRNRCAYRYFHVPEALHEGLLSATSKGRFFHRAIRGRFEFVLLVNEGQP